MGHNNKKKIIKTGLVSSIGLTAFACAAVTPSVFGTGTSGNVQLDTEIATSIAMKIVSPNDVNPDCTPESGITYGTANRYASSTGDNSGKVVDTFNGNEGEADELNTNTSCATLSMAPNTFDSTYSDVTVYTNSGTGYSLSVRSADNVSPNLVNTSDNTQYIAAGTLTEQDGTGEQAGQRIVPGGQNKWAIKTDTGVIDTWTAITTEDQTVRAYDQATNNGDTTRVTYGISAGSNPTGKYTTKLTYTATMFDGPNTSIPSADTSTSNNVTFSPADFKVPYKETRPLTITPNTGYYISSITCTDGYTCTDENGDPITIDTAAQSPSPITIRVTSENKTESGTVNVVTAPIEYSVSMSEDENNEANTMALSTMNLSIPYGGSRTVTFTPAAGYYLDSVECAEGYTCEKETTTGANINATNTTRQSSPLDLLFTNVSAEENSTAIETGEEAISTQSIKVTNNNTARGGSITFGTAPRHFSISLSGIGTGTGLTSDKDSLSIAYGHSANITITPEDTYFLSAISCPEGYTCTKPDGTDIDTGTSATNAQTIRVSNRRTVSGGTLSFTAYGNYDVAITPSLNATTSTNLLSIPYGGSKTFTITPTTGYYLTGVTCTSGYTCSGYTTGSASSPNATSRGTQTITVTNNSTAGTGAVSFSLSNLYTVSISNSATSTNVASVDVPYGGAATVYVTPSTGYYLSAVSCPAGYTCSGYGTGGGYTGQQAVTITNSSSASTGALGFGGAIRYFTVYVSNSNTSTNVSTLSVPYGGSATVYVTPNSGYYLSSISCPSGYSCSGYAGDTSYTYQQGVTVTNIGGLADGTIGFGGTAKPLVTLTVSQNLHGSNKSRVSVSSAPETIPLGETATIVIRATAGAMFKIKATNCTAKVTSVSSGAEHNASSGWVATSSSGGTANVSVTATSNVTNCYVTITDQN